jgi:hypothetical protein
LDEVEDKSFDGKEITSRNFLALYLHLLKSSGAQKDEKGGITRVP